MHVWKVSGGASDDRLITDTAGRPCLMYGRRCKGDLVRPDSIIQPNVVSATAQPNLSPTTRSVTLLNTRSSWQPFDRRHPTSAVRHKKVPALSLAVWRKRTEGG